MSGVAVADGAPFTGDRTGSTTAIRRAIRHRRLRMLGPAAGEPTTAGGRQWLDRARRALAGGDYQLAAYAAGRSRGDGEVAQSALILARAAAGMDLLEEAVVEAQRAVRLAPEVPEHHLTLAMVFEDLGNAGAALDCYRTAELVAPEAEWARAGRALVLAASGDAHRAEHLLESRYAAAVDRRTVGDCLGLVLTEVAERIPRVRLGETYVIVSPEEIALMRAKLARAAEVAADSELRALIGEVRRYVETCARRTWLSGRLLRGRAAWVPRWKLNRSAVRQFLSS